MNDTEKRIHNIEIALLAIMGVLEESLPRSQASAITAAAEDLFEKNRQLGGFTRPEMTE